MPWADIQIALIFLLCFMIGVLGGLVGSTIAALILPFVRDMWGM